MTVPGRFALHIQVPGGSVTPQRDWFENFDLPVERERGLGDRDDHLCIGRAELPLVTDTRRGIVASLDHDASADIPAALVRRQAHDRRVIERAVADHPLFATAPGWVMRLVLASDLYVIARTVPEMDDGRSVIAGYPWFGDWGRDTMIALPGLTLATGRFADARKILDTFARFVDRGMLSNVFPGAGAAPEYNTVDAALWFVEAWRSVYRRPPMTLRRSNGPFRSSLSIIEQHSRGTRYGIAVDPADGLLRAGEPGVSSTWMDARVGGWVVTPRIGKPVEINALGTTRWSHMAEIAQRLGEEAEPYRTAADCVREGFRRFVKPRDAGLFDVIDGPDGADPTVRPNQLLAVSLQASPLDGAMQQQVLEQCGAMLLTSYGLRSLAPGHADYRGHYRGGVAERDGSYHQGPVWVWLLGHWVLAHYRVHRDAAAAQAWLEPIADHLADTGLGQISEILDGDPPHTPRGAPAQAWSVACVLEAWWRLERAKRAPGRQMRHDIDASRIEWRSQNRPANLGEPVGIIAAPSSQAASGGYMMPTEKDKMLAGKLYNASAPEIQADLEATQQVGLARYNASLGMSAPERRALLLERLAAVGEGAVIPAALPL